MDNDNAMGVRRRRIFSLAVAAVSVITLAVMASLTLPATDDYQYRLFLRDGFDNFVEMNREHYETYTGRVFVHVCAQVVLWLGNWCFVAVCAVCCTAIPVCASLAGGRREDLPAGLAIFTAGLLALPYPVINQGMMWVSGFFNYVFPTALICLTLLLLDRTVSMEHPGPWRILGCVVLSFGCGASNEQSSLVALALTGWYIVRSLRARRGRLVPAVSFAAAAEGLSTILLSPATMDRAMVKTVEASEGIFERVLASAKTDIGFMTGNMTHGALLACFFILAGMALGEKLRARWPGVLGAVCAVPALASGLFTGGVATALTAALLVLTALWAAAAIYSGREIPGLIVLMGLFSLAVLLPTESGGGRVVTPYYLYLLASVSVLAGESLGRRRAAREVIFQTAILLLGLLGAVPFISGMVENYRIDLENRENIAEAKNTGVLMYRIDYDYTYTHQKVSVNVWREMFLKGEGLPEDTEMRFYSRERPNVYAGDGHFYPVMRLEDGTDLIAAPVVRRLGGGVFNAEDEMDAVAVYMPWLKCVANLSRDRRSAVATWTDEDGETHEREFVYRSADWLNFFPVEFYTDILGLEVTYDEAENAYTVAVPADKADAG